MPKYITLNKTDVENLWSQGFTIFKISHILNVSRYAVSKILKDNEIKPNKYNCKHTEETKLKLSLLRKQFLKNNPDKHPWRNNKKFKSVPCEKLKEWLKLNNIKFVSEYESHGVNGRLFSIDIAIPNKMIAIEVNGNQHYNKDGTLKQYYKEREDLLKNVGWSVYQIHYTMCFKLEEFKNLFENILTSSIKLNFDYENYTENRIKKDSFCKDCNKKIYKQSLRCDSCHRQYAKGKTRKPYKKRNKLASLSGIEPETKI